MAAMQDLRFGIRQLLRRKGSSLLAIVTVALGVGATTAIFSVVDSTMLRPLPYPNPEQLVSVGLTETLPDGKTSRPGPSMEDMLRLRTATDVFSSVEGFGSIANGYISDGATPERLQVVTFTEGYLAQHAVRPLLGRDFMASDMTGTSPLVALLGYGYWQARYGGQDVLGQTIRLGDHVATIVGVLPRTFNPNTPVSVPLIVTPDEFGRRGLGSRINIVARLQPGVTLDAATQRGSVVLGGPATVRLTSRLATVTTPQLPTVKVLLGGVGLLLLLACVNVAGLLLARGATRQSEVAVRASLGATRSRLIRQLLIESLVIAVPGAALGVLLAWITLDAVVANVPLVIPSNSPAAINLTVLLGTMLLLIPTVLIAGLLPAVRLSRVQLSAALMSGGRHGSTPLSRRGGQLLIGIEVALAVVLVSGAGLMLRSMMHLSHVDLGYEPRGLVTMQVLPLDQSPGVHAQYYASLLDRVRRLPGVESAAISNYFHMGTGMRTSAVRGSGGAEMVASYSVSPDYFATVGARLSEGRWPTQAEIDAGVRPVVLNQKAAALLFPDGSALGRTVMSSGPAARPATVVGVMEDVRNDGPTGTGRFYPQHVFFPLDAAPDDLTAAMTLIVRVNDHTRSLGNDLRTLAGALGPRVLVERIRSGEELLAAGVLTPKRRTVMLALLGGLGLLLAIVGIVGVTAFAVARRTREIGVRLAFGARPRQVVAVVLRDAVIPVLAGTLVGAGASYVATDAIRSFLFGVTPTDPWTLSTVSIAVALFGVAAAWVPALRATKVDPMDCLRAD